ncbi:MULTISPECIES: polysaccharide pyruvyl transferase family protein [unclassified Pseudoxanthomonas]|uniref:polysaccharide pyruvyl transferase family protein n=1 Tax=unclassified Pseudoxanthomonas TaxID=2645906 RepID=UPI0030783C40
MERNLRVSFTGYYGMRNFGDDLFGAICTAAAPHFWDARPRLVGPAIDGVSSRYTMPAWYPPGTYGATNVIGQASRLYSFLRAVRDTDVLVMGGGSVINGHGSFRRPLMLSAQRRGRLQLAAVGVSVGPFGDKAAQDSAAAFMRHFSYISVRDRRSYELAATMGVADRVHHGRDLAGLLPLLLPSSQRPQLPTPGEPLRIGIAPCRYSVRANYPTPEPSALQASLIESLVQLNTRYRVQPEIFSLNDHPEHGDLTLSEALQQGLSAHGISAKLVRYRGDPIATARAIGKCDAFVSTRLHGAIVAYMLGVPFMIVDYHPKCVDFADDVGLPWSRRITAQHHGVADFAQGFEAMLGEHDIPTLAHEDYTQQAQEIFLRAPWGRAVAA